MKQVKILLPALLLALSTLFTACNGDAAATQESEQPEATTEAAAPHGEGPEYTSAYVCPMHCEGSGSDEPGACPVCGMEYVAQAEHTTDGHGH